MNATTKMKTKIQAELSPTLAMEIEREAGYIEALPDAHEWTANELDRLESLRDASLKLAREVEAVFIVLNGR